MLGKTDRALRDPSRTVRCVPAIRGVKRGASSEARTRQAASSAPSAGVETPSGGDTVTRRRYHQRFKARAVGLVRETGKPIAQVARDLGIPHSTLRNWVALDEQRRSAA